MIIPGATETFDITITGDGVELPAPDLIYVTIAQDDDVIANKTGDDIAVAGNVITVHLTQHESLRLQNLKDGEVQVNYLVQESDGRYVRIPTIPAPLEVGKQLLRRILP